MNLETKITIYKFTPQLFTLTLEKSRLLFYYNGNSIPSIKKYGFYLDL